MGCLDIPNETIFTMEMTPIIAGGERQWADGG